MIDKKVIMIDEMIKISESCFSELAEVGYMQASCNDEKLVDFGDAIRIYAEEKFGILCNESYLLLSWFIHFKNEKRWEEEFENNVAM